jgi:hypothetical protein
MPRSDPQLKLEQCRAVARAAGGRCLSKRYDGSAKMAWRCTHGHEWRALAYPILTRGVWCPRCGDARGAQRRCDKTFATVRGMARERGGACLNDHYGPGDRLIFRCKAGHEWSTMAGVVLGQGAWCKRCASHEALRPVREKKLRQVRAIARRRGGKLLSTIYVNCATNMRWRCARGHEFEATANNVSNGTWCTRCAGVAKLTLEELQARARSRGGELLTKVYKSGEEPMCGFRKICG